MAASTSAVLLVVALMRALDRRPGKRLSLRHLRYLVVHRLSLARKTEANPNPVPDHLLTGADVIEAFRDPRMGTGGNTPYHSLVLLDKEGTLEQLLRLGVRGSHAGDTRPPGERKGYNWRSLSVAVIGNADERPITEPQYRRLVQVAYDLLPLCGELVGHTELPYASRDPNKRCPGRFLDLHPVRTAAIFKLPMSWASWSAEDRIRHAEQAGWEF